MEIRRLTALRRSLGRRSMQDCGCQLSRIILLLDWVHRGRRKTLGLSLLPLVPRIVRSTRGPNSRRPGYIATLFAQGYLRGLPCHNRRAAIQRPAGPLPSRRRPSYSSLLSRCAWGPALPRPPLRSPPALRPRSERGPCSRPCPPAASCCGGRSRSGAP